MLRVFENLKTAFSEGGARVVVHGEGGMEDGVE